MFTETEAFLQFWALKLLLSSGVLKGGVRLPRGLVVRNLPANAGDARDTGLIPGLGRYPGVGNSVHSSITVWKIPWTEEPGGHGPWGGKESDRTEHSQECACTHTHTHTHTQRNGSSHGREQIKWGKKKKEKNQKHKKKKSRFLDENWK